MNLLFSTFVIVRLITKSNHYNEKSSGLSGVMLMVMLFGREGSTLAYCRKSVCGVRLWCGVVWCDVVVYVVYDDCGRGI